MPYLTRNI